MDSKNIEVPGKEASSKASPPPLDKSPEQPKSNADSPASSNGSGDSDGRSSVFTVDSTDWLMKSDFDLVVDSMGLHSTALGKAMRSEEGELSGSDLSRGPKGSSGVSIGTGCSTCVTEDSALLPQLLPPCPLCQMLPHDRPDFAQVHNRLMMAIARYKGGGTFCLICDEAGEEGEEPPLCEGATEEKKGRRLRPQLRQVHVAQQIEARGDEVASLTFDLKTLMTPTKDH